VTILGLLAHAAGATSSVASTLMVRLTAVALALASMLTLLTGGQMSGQMSGQARHFPLETAAGLRLHNVAAEPAVLDGRKGLRVTLSADTLRRFESMAVGEVDDIQARVGQYAVVEGIEFSDGVITAEVTGAPPPGAGAFARGFVGVAFRLRDGAYDVFTLRMTNGRAEEQVRRNHTTQYASHPDWPWFRLRKEAPSRYESYVDLVPNVWTAIKIDVRGERARLYVHGQEQPTLIVNDLKSGARRTGAVALWVNHGTVAYFRNLTLTPDVPDIKE
jgi:hypothetical protein